MVLNLFLALLLNSFNSEELKSRKEVMLGIFLLYSNAFLIFYLTPLFVQQALKSQNFNIDIRRVTCQNNNNKNNNNDKWTHFLPMLIFHVAMTIKS